MQNSRAWRDRIMDVATILVALSAVAMAASSIWGPRSGRSAPPSAQHQDRSVDHVERLAESPLRLGAPHPRLTIVEFVDYECPYCRASNSLVNALLRSYPKDLAVVIRQTPLTMHPNAYAAAKLAVCAADEGRFEAMHEYLYSGTGPDRLDPRAAAKAAQIPDTARFIACSARPTNAQIESDLATAKMLNLNYTPGFVVGNTLLGSTPDSAKFFDLVRHRL